MWKGIHATNKWILLSVATSILLVLATASLFLIYQKKEFERTMSSMTQLQSGGLLLREQLMQSSQGSLSEKMAAFSKKHDVDAIFLIQNKKVVAAFTKHPQTKEPSDFPESQQLHQYTDDLGYFNLAMPVKWQGKEAMMVIRAQLELGRYYWKDLLAFFSIILLCAALFLSRLHKKVCDAMNGFIKKKKLTFDLVAAEPDIASGEIELLVDSMQEMLGGFEKNRQELLDEQRQEMDKILNYDSLTGLPNRNYLLQSILPSFLEKSNDCVCLFMIDITRFKTLNEHLGHDAADMVLKILSQRLSFEFSKSKELDFSDVTIAKFTVDQFVVAVRCRNNNCQSETWINYIRNCVSSPFDVFGKEVFIKVNIGYSYHPRDADSPSRLVHAADVALHYAKKDATSDFCVYEKSFSEELDDSFAIEASLKKAIELDQLVLYFQPKLNLGTGQIDSVEALLRWHHPKHGVITPDKFISLAETSDLINEIGRWVIARACEAGRQWQEQMNAHIKIAVNLSQRQFYDANLIPAIKSSLDATGFDSELLEIEITESVLVVNDKPTKCVLEELKQIGISVALDDFGTGYSSLRYLSQLPVDALKIDRSFIDGVPHDLKDIEITNTIITLAHNLHKTVTAEGVENRAQLEYLLQTECDCAQGFLIEQALQNDDFMKFYMEFDGEEFIDNGRHD